MEWLNKKRLGIILGVSILLIFVLIVGIRFYKETNSKPIEKEPIVLPNEDELEFSNESSMSVDTVWNLVNEKRDALKKLFYEGNVYLASEIDKNKYSKSDDEKYVVFQETFFKTLEHIVDESIYINIFNRVTLLKQDANHSYYIAEKTVFDDIYNDSAIATNQIVTELVRVLVATDEVINATISLSACAEYEDCKEKTSFPFELKKQNETWKISSFQK